MERELDDFGSTKVGEGELQMKGLGWLDFIGDLEKNQRGKKIFSSKSMKFNTNSTNLRKKFRLQRTIASGSNHAKSFLFLENSIYFH